MSTAATYPYFPHSAVLLPIAYSLHGDPSLGPCVIIMCHLHHRGGNTFVLSQSRGNSNRSKPLLVAGKMNGARICILSSALSYLLTPSTSTSHLRSGEKRMLDHIIRFIALTLHVGVNLLMSQRCFGCMMIALLSSHFIFH